jgi:hypothetical protein
MRLVDVEKPIFWSVPMSKNTSDLRATTPDDTILPVN